MTDDGLVLLQKCGNTVEATATRAMLEAEGIEAHIHGEHHRAQLGFLGAYVDLRLMVRASDLEDARELLEEMKYAEHLRPEEDEPIDHDSSVKRWREHAGEEPPIAEAPDLERPAPRPRSVAVPVLLGLLLGLGTGHFYAGRFGTAAVIFVLQVTPSLLLENTAWVLALIGALRILDAIGGAVALRKANGELTRRQLASPRSS